MPSLHEIIRAIIDFTQNTVLPTLHSIFSDICHSLPDLSGFASTMENARGDLHKILLFMGVCDCFLFLGSVALWSFPTMGFNIMLVSFLSFGHTAFIWMVMHKHPLISRLLEAFSGQYVIGMVFGITFMMMIIALLMAVYFRHAAAGCVKYDAAALATATTNATNDALIIIPKNFECYTTHGFAMKSVAFFESLLFLTTGLLTVIFLRGEDLGMMDFASHQYEDLDMQVDEREVA